MSGAVGLERGAAEGTGSGERVETSWQTRLSVFIFLNVRVVGRFVLLSEQQQRNEKQRT